MSLRYPPVIALSLLPALLAAPVLAQEKKPDPAKQLQQVQRDLQEADKAKAQLDAKAEALEKELADLRARAIEAADQQRSQADELARLEGALGELGEEEKARLDKIEADRAALADLLGALQRLSRLPPDTMVAAPQSPSDTVKSALLLRSAVPELKTRADALSKELQGLVDLRRQLAQQKDKTARAAESLALRQKDLATLVARREEVSKNTDSERTRLASRVASLGERAGDLKDLIEKLEAERRAEAARKAEAERRRQAQVEADREKRTRDRVAGLKRAPPEPQSAGILGGMVAPVSGKVVKRYGQTDEVGATSRGLTYTGRAGGPVVAPADGAVMFAGPFKGYGLLLILEHANGYHSLLSGLGRIDAQVGQRVLGGEPVGLLSGDGDPTLYYELRRGGQPVNPARGLAASDGKGQG
ncbi:peptidoglycan DD-metalloendopeptidase family protein [Niveispirillum sp.]|uniref:murein hydrolase activator EnvC family protein n=1 Tax=Niveispirillum sp. TaxID=1917217 RepID=UPI001B4C39BB|nr:peptidoglycan DD-metalloendopeptidase family protein [Niveispirillum sp.]MBP7336048.1 peptidoglycan DD-metalloendopeptidase family protein [Niveispirillum sp.]